MKKLRFFSYLFMFLASMPHVKAEDATFLVDQIVEDLWNGRRVPAGKITEAINATEDLLGKRGLVGSRSMSREESDSSSGSTVASSTGSVRSNVSEENAAAYMHEMRGKYEDVDQELVSSFFTDLEREELLHREAVFEIIGMLHARY